MKQIFCFLITILSITDFNARIRTSLINTSHLDHLYEEIVMNSENVGIIHIYSEAPDYNWVGDDDEGIACVDDAARAAVFYMRHYRLTGEKKEMDKAKNLIKFVFQMQAENGFFYNFIWPDHTINKTYKTSVAEPNWWSWRALWALSEASHCFQDEDEALCKQIDPVLKKGIEAAERWLIKEKKFLEFGGFRLPAWLPYESASDQASVLVKTMLNYFQSSGDSLVIKPARSLCDGIMLMQAGDSSTIPFNAFLSWQNTWHAWGNSQSDALLTAGKIFLEKKYIASAQKELKNFYPFLIKEKFFSDFAVEKKGELNEMIKSSRFSQIAYGIRPIVFACINAYELINDTSYAGTAIKAAGWFFGDNIAGKLMYDVKTGRAYDGIISEEKINFNSGAESTIEALLTLLRIEENPKTKEMMLSVFRE